ncbi:MAG: vancomycin permeability regulator SanA [Flammeovirgaceae bacterium]|jgi:vancomycin permeability regulator SanA
MKKNGKSISQLFSILKIAVKLGLLFFLIHTILIISDGLSDELQQADFAVVLGNKVELNGKPSLRLKSRLDKAVEIYKLGFVNKIIVSGGFGKEGFDEGIIMRDYLVENEIPRSRLITDSKGNTTFLTAKNTLGFAKKTDRIMVISHYYHISRTKLAFKRFGFENVVGVHANSHLEAKEPISIFREFVGFYYYLFRSY